MLVKKLISLASIYFAVVFFLGAYSGLAGIVPGTADKENASDAGLLDAFGSGVAMTDDYIIVSAPSYDGPVSNGGAVYVYDRATGDELSPILLADANSSQPKMGYSLAADGNLAVAGAPFDDDNGTDAGAAYLFNLSTRTLVAKLKPDDGTAGDQFGKAVAISGNLVLVGAEFAEEPDDDDADNKGSAYIFDATTGNQLFELLPDTPSENALFGNAVALNGTTALVGAKADGSGDTGAVYLFDTTTGLQDERWAPTNLGNNDFFGSSLSADNGLAVIGAQGDSEAGAGFGSAYLFDIATGDFIKKLFPDAAGNFGATCSIQNWILIGSFTENNSIGSTYLFSRKGKRLAKITAFDSQVGDLFGSAVAQQGTDILIGSPKDDDNAGGSGSAYLYPVVHDGIDLVIKDGLLQWDSIPGTSYDVYATTDLSSLPMTPFTTLSAVGPVSMTAISPVKAREFFYIPVP